MAAVPPPSPVHTPVDVAARPNVFELQGEMPYAVRFEYLLQLPTEEIGARAQRKIFIAHHMQSSEDIACSRSREWQ